MSHDKLESQFTPLSPARVALFGPSAETAPLAATLSARGIAVEQAASLEALRAALAAAPFQAALVVLPAKIAAADLAELLDCAAGAGRRFVAVVSRDGKPAAGAPPADLWLAKEDLASAAGPLERAVATARLEEALAEVERLRKAVLYARETAHDIAQPLTTILARAQLLAMNAKPEEKIHRGATIIAEEADRMATIAERFYRLKEMVLPPK